MRFSKSNPYRAPEAFEQPAAGEEDIHRLVLQYVNGERWARTDVRGTRPDRVTNFHPTEKAAELTPKGFRDSVCALIETL